MKNIQRMVKNNRRMAKTISKYKNKKFLSRVIIKVIKALIHHITG
jgi:hypothetical protein